MGHRIKENIWSTGSEVCRTGTHTSTWTSRCTTAVSANNHDPRDIVGGLFPLFVLYCPTLIVLMGCCPTWAQDSERSVRIVDQVHVLVYQKGTWYVLLWCHCMAGTGTLFCFSWAHLQTMLHSLLEHLLVSTTVRYWWDILGPLFATETSPWIAWGYWLLLSLCGQFSLGPLICHHPTHRLNNSAFEHTFARVCTCPLINTNGSHSFVTLDTVVDVNDIRIR